MILVMAPGSGREARLGSAMHGKHCADQKDEKAAPCLKLRRTLEKSRNMGNYGEHPMQRFEASQHG